VDKIQAYVTTARMTCYPTRLWWERGKT